uniref:Uncharacterized protein n=1 Tax=Panagrolaimus davidi TaxID=227884 RepID=A0A914QK32_9BILA
MTYIEQQKSQQSRNDYYRNESRQSNYNDRYTSGNDRYGGGISTTLNNDRPYTPKLSSPVVNPANTNGYHRSEVSSKVQDQNGYRHESRREEYRSESRNGILTQPRSSSVAPPLLDTWRSDSRGGDRARDYRSDSRNNDYRVESPQSNFGTLNRRNNGAAAATTSTADEQNRSESRAESVRSVRILRKTFE